MRKSLQFASILFCLSLLAIVVLLGTDIATPLGVGGPLEDVYTFGDVQDGDDGYIGAQGNLLDNEWMSASARLAAEAEAAKVLAQASRSDLLESSAPDITDTPDDEADRSPTVGGGDSADERLAEAVAEPKPEPKPEVITHVIQRGETLWDIARAYDIDVDTIVAANDWVDAGRLRIGDKLSILTIRGAVHTVQRGESLWDISRAYGVGIEKIADTNGITDPSRLQVQTRLVIPGAQAQAAALRRDAVVSAEGRLVRNFEWPLRGRISSRYGPRWGRVHHGLDVAVPIGTPIRAAAGGTVSFSGVQGGYGNIVIIDHGNGIETRYAHTSRNVVSRGQRVQRGTIIAYSGNTGDSTGPHLHFEIRQRGQSVNPETYLK